MTNRVMAKGSNAALFNNCALGGGVWLPETGPTTALLISQPSSPSPAPISSVAQPQFSVAPRDSLCASH
jgi:hypothetical protein